MSIGLIVAAFFIGQAVYYHVNYAQPYVDSAHKDLLNVVNNLPRITNDTQLTVQERIDILRSHHLLTPEQDTQLTLFQKDMEKKIFDVGQPEAMMVTIGVFAPIVTAAVCLVRK